MQTIELNLIPQNMRRRRRGRILAGIKIPLENIVGLFGAVVMLLIILHGSLLLLNFYKINQHHNLKRQWEVTIPARDNVDRVIKEIKELQTKQKAIEKITMEDRVLWAPKLNVISDKMDRGVWLTRIRLKDRIFFIEGSAISKQGDEMNSVHTFTASLKNENAFLEKFSDLELGSIQRRYINKTEVADFLITAKLVEEGEGG